MTSNRVIPSQLASVLLAIALCAPALAAAPWGKWQGKPDTWYQSAEGRQAAATVLSWQSPHGGWPKNTDTTTRPFTGNPKTLQGTFDNGATTNELRFLARAFRATNDRRCRQAFLKGLVHILEAQYPTGGWPQFHPPGRGYHRHITFNDDAMVRLMDFVRDVAASEDYAFVGASARKAAQAGFDRGVQCILKCQVRVKGKPTAWCAQHDEKDYRPRPARSYELVSLSGAESVGVLRLLMSLERPSAEVVRAVQGAAEWFEAAKLTGIRIEKVDGNKVVVRDAKAPALWARFYEIGSNRPIFCGRDGVQKRTLAEIEAERRNGYAWYGAWGRGVAKDYAQWKAKQGASKAAK